MVGEAEEAEGAVVLVVFKVAASSLAICCRSSASDMDICALLFLREPEPFAEEPLEGRRARRAACFGAAARATAEGGLSLCFATTGATATEETGSGEVTAGGSAVAETTGSDAWVGVASCFCAATMPGGDSVGGLASTDASVVRWGGTTGVEDTASTVATAAAAAVVAGGAAIGEVKGEEEEARGGEVATTAG